MKKKVLSVLAPSCYPKKGSLLKLKPVTVLVLLLLSFATIGKAQVINECFEENVWSASTNAVSSSGTNSGAYSITATSASSTVTYYTFYGASNLTATSINTTPNSGLWYFSKASIGTDTRLAKVRSVSRGVGMGNSGYIITPVLPTGVGLITFWVAGGNEPLIHAGLATGTNTFTASSARPSVANVVTSVGGLFNNSTQTFASGVTYTSGTSTVTSSQMRQVTYTGTFNGSAQFGLFNLSGGTIYIDDLVVYAPATTPTTQASAINFSSVTATGMTVNWTNGNGANRAVFVKEATQGTITNPTDGASYTASSNWNNGAPAGTQLGTSGYYCVYNGSGNSVGLTSLTPSTTYWVQVFEYNGGDMPTGGTLFQRYNIATASNNPNSQVTAVPSPTIVVLPTSLSFSFVKSGTSSAEQTYSLSAVFLSPAAGDITVTAPTGFEVSLNSGTGFGSSVLVPYTTSTLAATTIYVRFAPVALIPYSANITNAGGGATTQNVAVSGTGSLYNIGDYMSKATSTWGAAGTWNKWDGGAWVASGDFPNAATADVYVDGGFTVTNDASARNCNNLYVRNNSILVSSSSSSSTIIYLRVNGSTVSVETGSRMGNAQDLVTGNTYDGLSVDAFGSSLTFTGGGAINLARLRTNNTGGTSLTIDNDIALSYHGSTNGGNATALYPQAGDNNTLTINAGKILKFNPWSCFAINSSSHTNGAFSQTVNVYGKINFVDGNVPGNGTTNGWPGHTNGYFSLAMAAGKFFNLNIKNGGEINVSELYPQGTKADDTPGAGAGTSSIVVEAGGKLTVSKIADVRNATQTITGAGEFALSSGASIKIGSANGLNPTTGNIQTTTTTLSAGANYSYDGTASQTTGTGLPSTVAKLTINNATGVTLSSPVTVTGSLVNAVGSLELSNNNVTLASTASATASLPATTVPTPFTYGGTGKFNVQRYVPGGKRAFRFLAHPFSSTLNLGSLTDNIIVTGGSGTGGFTSSGSNSPSAYWYNTTAGDENVVNDLGWTAFTTTDGTGSGNAWSQYKGIRVLVRGSIADGLSPVTPSAVTLDAAGQVNTGTQTIPVIKGTNSGYNFIGNPFASNIDLTTAGGNVTLGGSLVTNFYVWDISAGTKGAWVNTAFSGSYILPSFAGFIVKTAAADNITITENAKTTAAATGTLYRNSNANLQMVRLSVKANNNTWDRFELYYNNESKLTEDKHDGIKFQNSEVNFFSIASNKNYSIDSRPFVVDDIIPMGFSTTVLQDYTIKASEYSLPANVELYLRDKLLGIETKIEEGTEYSFSVNANASTQGNNRFELVQKQATPIFVASTDFSIKFSPNPATDMVKVTFNNQEKSATTITLVDAVGKKIRTVNAGNVQQGEISINVKGLAKGSYYITLNNAGENKTGKLQIQ